MYVLYEQESPYESGTILGIYPTIELVLEAASHYVTNDSWKRASLSTLYYEHHLPNSTPAPKEAFSVEQEYKFRSGSN